jgi:hypothetical protein
MRICRILWVSDIQFRLYAVNSVQFVDMYARPRFDTTSFVSYMHGYDRGNTYWRYNTAVLSYFFRYHEAKTGQYIWMLKAPPNFDLSAMFLLEEA